ncbi:MAG: hypothetical protein E6J34_21515 [Chloroflexi bacterium]|nr:MAG: hypothetical protein E6J34_21515 [Chloroflexota bacterium]
MREKGFTMTDRTEQQTDADKMMIQTSAKATSHSRLVFIDNLKAALIILVVVEHFAVMYSDNIAFFQAKPVDTLALLVLVLFQLLSLGYFMGLFFLISGYFTPKSFDHKGAKLYLRDRLLRLGIPTLIYMFILNPIAAIILTQTPGTFIKMTTLPIWQQYIQFIGIGSMWFAIMLLIFECGYVAWRMVAKRWANRVADPIAWPHFGVIFAFILVLALTSYLVRIAWPLGKIVFGFPSLAYVPQYLSLFLIGIVASRNNWLRTWPESMGKRGFWLALVGTLILLPIALNGQLGTLILFPAAISGQLGTLDGFLGSGTWQSGVYALWDSSFCVGICLFLITFFRRFIDSPGRLGKFLSQQAFTVYVIHIPIVIFVTLALYSLHIELLLRFGLAAAIGVPLCFSAAYLVRKIPLADKIVAKSRDKYRMS